jgi:hypothetical protein
MRAGWRVVTHGGTLEKRYNGRMITLLQRLFREYGTEQTDALRLRVRAMGAHAIPSLLPSLQSAEQMERIWAAKLLGDIGENTIASILPALQKSLAAHRADTPENRVERPYYVEAIARFSSVEAMATLQMFQEDNDPRVRRIALRALNRLENNLKTVPSTITTMSNIAPAHLPNSDLSDSDFLAQFEATTLPKKLWTHEAHIRMAYLYLRHNPDIDTLLPLVRARIGSYNLAQSNKNGYHETITVAFLRIVRARMQQSTAQDFTQFRDEHPGIFQNTYLMRHYSEATLFSPEARRAFVPPDREPLP